MRRMIVTNAYRLGFAAVIGLILGAFAVLAVLEGQNADAEQSSGFTGGLNSNLDSPRETPIPVRNDSARAGQEIVTKRYFRIKKGVFPEFYRASEQGVWPYFEKLGARVIGMWQVVHPNVNNATVGDDSTDYDEVILMTRYASVDHWKATRDTTAHGGNGPDWDKCLEALKYRRSVTLDTSIDFLRGTKWDNAPWFLPGLGETYELAAP